MLLPFGFALKRDVVKVIINYRQSDLLSMSKHKVKLTSAESAYLLWNQNEMA